VVNGATPAPDLGLVTAGAEWRMAHNWSLMARFDGEFGNGDQHGAAALRVVIAPMPQSHVHPV
jgi:uncharacterized protein with beta-barrel porin domain